MSTYHEGSRTLQDRFSTRKLADRVDELLVREFILEEDKTFIESRPFFFLATADEEGKPDCSYKGGAPGFVKVIDPTTLTFPSYDGNGMFKSFGNVLSNPFVGLLFIDFESPKRLRLNGQAFIENYDPNTSPSADVHFIIRVQVDLVFPNCSRYINQMETTAVSQDPPKKGHTPPKPEWKSKPEYAEVLPSNLKK